MQYSNYLSWRHQHCCATIWPIFELNKKYSVEDQIHHIYRWKSLRSTNPVRLFIGHCFEPIKGQLKTVTSEGPNRFTKHWPGSLTTNSNIFIKIWTSHIDWLLRFRKSYSLCHTTVFTPPQIYLDSCHVTLLWRNIFCNVLLSNLDLKVQKKNTSEK